MKFIEGAVLVAHNADFDIGFVSAACKRLGIDFAPVYADTLVLSQTLLPDLKRHKLDIVASRLGLAEYRHHRADDDAYICARLCERFFAMQLFQIISELHFSEIFHIRQGVKRFKRASAA